MDPLNGKEEGTAEKGMVHGKREKIGIYHGPEMEGERKVQEKEWYRGWKGSANF